MWETVSGKKINDFKQSLINMINFAQNNKKIVVGCDSQVLGNRISFVTVVIVINIGRGANFIYNKEFQNNNGKLSVMQNRLFQQTIRSVKTAKIVDDIIKKYNLHVEQIHSDINPDKRYKSNRVVSSCIGFISSCGYKAIIKPYSFAASQTADSLTR